MENVTIGIAGAGGRMGRMLCQGVHAHPQATLTAALEHAQSPHVGTDAGSLAGLGAGGVVIGSNAGDFFSRCRVAIDFTLPQATLAHVQQAVASRVPMVIGTTGLTPEERQAINQAAGHIPIVFAPNFSVGVNLLFHLAKQAASILQEGFDVEIIEAHHRHKVDAPSGTALHLGEVVAKSMGRELTRDGVFSRHGVTGERKAESIGFSVIRGGDIVGDHTLLFAGDGERVELTHKAASRMTFAAGAVRAAVWLAEKEPGLYDMGDVLGF